MGQEGGWGVDAGGAQGDITPQPRCQLVRHPHLAPRRAADDETHDALALRHSRFTMFSQALDVRSFFDVQPGSVAAQIAG